MSSERSVKDVFGPYNRRYGGEGGIRTHGTVSRTLAFEASTFNRSVTSPRPLVIVTDALVFRQCDLPPMQTRRNLTLRVPGANDVRRKRIESASRIHSPQPLATPRPDD